MNGSIARKPLSARTTCLVNPQDVSKILCHRVRNQEEQYLVQWRSDPNAVVPRAKAIASWHNLWELARCLHQVQIYIESRAKLGYRSRSRSYVPGLPANRKRKTPDDDSAESRDATKGAFGVDASHRTTPSRSSTLSVSIDGELEPLVYNGVLERKDGQILALCRCGGSSGADAVNLPTPLMSDEALLTPMVHAERFIRKAFYTKLNKIPRLYLENKVDASTPSLNFRFIEDYVLREGVCRADPGTQEGCPEPCKPNMGRYLGCEYTALCSCLEFAAVDESRLEDKAPEVYAEYLKAKGNNEFIDTSGLPKRFPYQKGRLSKAPATLIRFYLESRNPIYECNQNCNCGSVCKSRVVQKGRSVPLTIFKTVNRGWGVYCNEDLVQGEFIDTYRGEVITNAEADRREAEAGLDKASYLYSLDKFVGDHDDLTEKTCHVVDGEYMGGPTRFINHSCEPNCRQFTVSYNKHDNWVYDIAFFALEDIPRGTELTFDYVDLDEDEEEDVERKQTLAAMLPGDLEKKPCHCGAKKCRGYLWA